MHGQKSPYAHFHPYRRRTRVSIVHLNDCFDGVCYILAKYKI